MLVGCGCSRRGAGDLVATDCSSEEGTKEEFGGRV